MLSNKLISQKGLIYITFYVITSAISNVFVNHTTKSIDPIVALFYTSIVTILFFSFMNFRELHKNSMLIKENKIAILWLNFLNTIIWLVIFYSLKILSPSVFSCLFLGAIPIHLFVLELQKSKIKKKNNFKIAILLFIMFVLMLLLAAHDIKNGNTLQILKYGALVTIVGGAVAAYIMLISKKLSDKKLSASLVVSLRFYGILIVSLIIILTNQSQLLIAPTLFIELALLALTSMAFPLFLLQKSLKTLNPLYASIIITTIPVLTYFLQLFSGYYAFSFTKLAITVLFSAILVVITYLKKNKL